MLAVPGDLDPLFARAEQDHLALARRQVLPRLVERDAELARHGRRDVRGPALVAPGPIPPRLDGAVADRQVAVRHDEVRVDLHARAEAVAVDAHADRAVERKRLRRQLGQADAAVGAGARLAVGALARLTLDRDQDRATADLHRRLDRVGQAGPLARVDADAVDHDLDRVFLLLVEGGDVLQPLDEAVDAHAREAGLARLFEHLAKLALAVLRLARHQRRARLGRQGQQLVDDLRRRSGGDLAPAQVAALLARARVEHAQVVVDLGDRTDGRAWVGRRRLLLDGDGRRQPAQLLVLGLLHLPEKLARVRRQRLDVAPLPLGIQRVERQRRFSRSRHAREHDQRSLRDPQLVDREIVLARAAHDDEIRLIRARAQQCRLFPVHERRSLAPAFGEATRGRGVKLAGTSGPTG